MALSDIRQALTTFRASVSQTPGRMNLFNLGSYIEIRYSYYKFFELLRGGEMSIFEATMLICFGMSFADLNRQISPYESRCRKKSSLHDASLLRLSLWDHSQASVLYGLGDSALHSQHGLGGNRFDSLFQISGFE